MDNLLNGLWIINAEAKTVYASDRMAEILGTTPAAMKGQPSFGYLFPEDVDAAQRLFDEKRSGQPIAVPFSSSGARMEASSGLMW
jgi:PAS domain-containing protein